MRQGRASDRSGPAAIRYFRHVICGKFFRLKAGKKDLLQISKAEVTIKIPIH